MGVDEGSRLSRGWVFVFHLWQCGDKAERGKQSRGERGWCYEPLDDKGGCLFVWGEELAGGLLIHLVLGRRVVVV